MKKSAGNRRFPKVLAILLGLLASVSFILPGCSLLNKDDDDDDVNVTGVTLSSETEEVFINDSLTLSATVTPSDASNKKVTWKSSDETVATINNGVVTPVAAGTTTITVTTVDGSYTATCTVTVTNTKTTTETKGDGSTITTTVTVNTNGSTVTEVTTTTTDGTSTTETTITDKNGAQAEVAAEGEEIEFSGYKWQMVKGSAYTNDGVLVVSQSEIGIAMQLADSELADLYTKYPDGFAVTAVVRPTTIKSLSGTKLTSQGAGDSGADFALASHIGKTSAGKDSWYSFSINFNGRTQLGDAWKMKGRQFGSLLTDSSGTIFKKAIDEPYTMRLQYNANGTTEGRINGIRQSQNGQYQYTPQTDATVTRSPTNGSFGFVNDKVSEFELYSFAVHDVDKGLETINLKTDNGDIAVIKDGFTDADGGTFVFLKNSAYTTRVGGDNTTFTIIAKNDAGEDALSNVTISNSNAAAATATLADGVITVAPVAEGEAVVTVTNGEAVRTITVTVEEAASYSDTDYEAADNLYPKAEATGVYEDDHLILTFDDTPELVEGDIEIYEASDLENPVCTISVDSSVTNAISDGTNTQILNLRNFMVQVVDKTVEIIPTDGALENGKTYVIGIANGVITGTINGKTFTGFDPSAQRWSFTTRASKPTVGTTIAVGKSDTADFRTVQGAFKAVSGASTITVEKGTYREVLFYKKAYDITIAGDTTTEYGSDVVVVGINCNEYNGSTSTRGVFTWNSSNSLTFKNITLQNAMDRNTMISGNSSQSEALYFNGSYLAAYNSSFKGFQDTLLINKGRAWFYKCYVEGDTDFIWGSADAALFEECKIVQLDTSSDTKKASASYVFETRVSNEANTTVGKGFVLFNSTLESKHPSSYLARRASAKNSSGNYYDQAAFINVTGSGTLLDAFGGSNEPVYIEKDSDENQHVGIKYYGGNLSASLFDKDWEGTISESIYNAEYSGRNVILNKVFKKSNSKYVNADEIWDISTLATAFSATNDTSELATEEEVSGASGTYDLCTLAQEATGASTYQKGDALTDGVSSDGYVTWKHLQYHSGSSSYGAQSDKTNGTVITVQVAGASVVTWTGSQYSNGTVTVSDGTNTIVDAVSTKEITDKTSQGFLYTGSDAATLTITFNVGGVTYINKLVVSAIDDETDSVSAIALSGTTTLTVGATSELMATVTAAYLSTDTSLTWKSSNESVATVADGVVTAVGAGSATITATSKATPSVSKAIEIIVSADEIKPVVGKVYTYDLITAASTTSVSDLEGNGITISISGSPALNTGYGLYNVAAEYAIPVAGDATIIAYVSYASAESELELLSGDTSLGTRIVAKGDYKPANGPVAVTWRYTGSADTLTLKVPATAYLAKIVSDNTASPSALIATSYLFTDSDKWGDATGVTASTVGSKLPQVAADAEGASPLFFYSTNKLCVYNGGSDGLKTQPNSASVPVYLTFTVGGACTITVNSSTLDNAPAVYCDGTELGAMTADSDTPTNYTYSYTGTGVGVLSIALPSKDASGSKKQQKIQSIVIAE